MKQIKDMDEKELKNLSEEEIENMGEKDYTHILSILMEKKIAKDIIYIVSHVALLGI